MHNTLKPNDIYFIMGISSSFYSFYLSGTLLGMSLSQAKEFINTHPVYYDIKHAKHKVNTSTLTDIRVIEPGHIYTKEYVPTRINVTVDQDIITEILSCG